MNTLAAVLIETGKPLVLVELEIPPLREGQVLIEVFYSGLCHTQILECHGFRGQDPYLPHCLGHEGTGIVSEIGPGVTKVKPGDRVILSWMKGSGIDASGTTYRWNRKTVNAGPITTLGKHSVISENRVTPLKKGVNLQESVVLGCTVATGFGAVMNTAKPRSGQSIAIFGTGGIGLSAVAGGKILGCSPITAVDIRSDKLELAKQMGATHCIDARKIDPVEGIGRICPNGLDFAIEATGRPQVMVQALRSVRNQGGTVVVIGNARHGEKVEFDPRELNLGKRLLGTWGGDNMPDRDFLHYSELLSNGKLKLKLLLSKTYRLSEINQALDDLECGKIVRPLIDMSARQQNIC